MAAVFTNTGGTITGIKYDAAALAAIDAAKDAEGTITVLDTIKGYTVTGIAKDAFSSVNSASSTFPQNVKGMVWPASLATIGAFAFQYVPGLHKVDFSATAVTEIGECTFENCVDLEDISFPLGLTKIGDMAFQRCQKLKKVVFPPALTTIGDSTFKACSSLHQADFSAVTGEYVTFLWDTRFSAAYTFADCAFFGRLSDSDTYVVIPAGKNFSRTGDAVSTTGFFRGNYGLNTAFNIGGTIFVDSGWNGLTGIVTDTGNSKNTWVKVYGGSTASMPIWP
jgi:hypothetical protein